MNRLLRPAFAALLATSFLAAVAGCQTEGNGSSASAAKPAKKPADLVTTRDIAGPNCSAGIVADLPAPGDHTLRIITNSYATDRLNEQAFARALLARRDGKPLGTLGQLAAPGGALRCRTFRDPSTGGGIPPYTAPYVCLILRHPDGSLSRLLWESAYNGYMGAKNPPFPVGQWAALDLLNGIYWPQTDATNFNLGAGFQPLAKFVAGHTITRKDGVVSPLYGPETPIVAIGIGSGSGLPGHLLAYVDDFEIKFAGGMGYLATFDP
ncbi:MAG: hypothetical protein NTW19_16945 [Planctomycetota bacterium]|nr:hypothetical protein [Planctomycetota bacterium]